MITNNEHFVLRNKYHRKLVTYNAKYPYLKTNKFSNVVG